MTRLAPARYFQLIDSDTERLLEMASRGLGADVPSCPGWTVADLVSHVAHVYEHKVRTMADAAMPKPWPPADFEGREPIAFLRAAKDDLFVEYSRHDLDEPTATFSAEDTTIAFWVRRMALEIAIHRTDGEQAYGSVTPVPADEAVDGVDEVLTVMLAGPWWADGWSEHPVNARVDLVVDDRCWRCELDSTSATVTRITEPEATRSAAAASIRADPEAMFLWLWGRAPDSAVAVAGDAGVAAQFRLRIKECTG